MEKYKADILLTKKIIVMEIDGQQYQTPIIRKHRDVGLFYFEFEKMYDEYNTSFLKILEQSLEALILSIEVEESHTTEELLQDVIQEILKEFKDIQFTN